jgi:hypothetical protein
VNQVLVSQIVLLAFGILGLGVLALAIQHRVRRKSLVRIAKKHALGLQTGTPPRTLVKHASRYLGRERRTKVADVLAGCDEDGEFFSLRRKFGRVRHQLLFFELQETARIDGFHVRPEKARGHSPGLELNLHWKAPGAQWSDERALSMAARVLHNLAAVSERPGAHPMGVELKGRRIWIHSLSTLHGDGLDRFLSDGLLLRKLLLKSLKRASGVGKGQRNASRLVQVLEPTNGSGLTPVR